MNNKPLNISISGVGGLYSPLFGWNSYFSVQNVTLNYGDADNTLYVYSDGRPGKATITISVDGKVVGTRTVMFYGKATSMTVTPKMTIGKEGVTTGSNDVGNADCTESNSYGPYGDVCDSYSATVPAFTVLIKDALGTPVAVRDGSFTATTSDGNVAIGSIDWFQDSGDGDYTNGSMVVVGEWFTSAASKSGDKATLTLNYANLDGTVLTGSLPVSIGGAIASEDLSFDAASYAPNAPIKITRTAKDAKGNPVFDGSTAAAVVGAAGTVPGVTLASSTYVGGKVEKTVFAPATAGTYNLSMTTASGAVVTRSFTVTSAPDITAIQSSLAAVVAAIAKLQKAIKKINKRLKR